MKLWEQWAEEAWKRSHIGLMKQTYPNTHMLKLFEDFYRDGFKAGFDKAKEEDERAKPDLH